MTSATGSKLSMIIDGIAASEAIDSSGEILDVKGCDISDFENGVGVLNYEHRGDDAHGASGNDIVGKIIFAKKIYKKEDCADKRQEAYWDSVKLPFVYIRARLYDGAGHAGAQALAAIIRDAVIHKEPILARFSIEGSTLKKEGQRLVKTIARKVAVTLKPANKSAVSGLVSDPNAPKPITEKQADKSLLDQLLDAGTSTFKSDIPGRQKLGGHTMAYESIEYDADPSEKLRMTAQNLRTLLKAMEAGQGGGAPSTLVGGAALQREDDRLHQFDKNKLKNDLRAAVRDMPDSARLSRDGMFKFFKFKLPEVNEQFLDHFTDLIDDIRTRQVGDWVEKTMKVWEAVKKTEAKKPKALEKEEAELPKIDYTPSKEADPPTTVPQGARGGAGLSEQGQILSSKLVQKQQKLELYPYEKDELFDSLLNADSQHSQLDSQMKDEVVKKAHTPWRRAMANWMALNRLSQHGNVPSSVIAEAAIFSALSPNTGVPTQELYYGHYQDFLKKHGPIFTDPKGVSQQDAEQFHKWLNQTTPPEFFREYYLQGGEGRSTLAYDVERKNMRRGAEATLEKRPQGVPLLNYHRFHPFMTALHKEVKDDGRAFVDYIMQQKSEHGAKAMMAGFGPKLARYMALMLGKGNVIVPDRHFIRALFNLPLGDPRNKYALSILAPVKGEKLLRAIDHHYFNNSPAVQKVLHLWPDHFKDREMQAVGPAFWLHWLIQPHYNKLRGEPVENTNEGSAHDPYFKRVIEVLDAERIPHSGADPLSLTKNERPFSLPARVARATKTIEEEFGEVPASFFFALHGLPALMMEERVGGVDPVLVRKMEELSVEFAKLFKSGELEGLRPKEEWPPSQLPEVDFQGSKVTPGAATLYATKEGQHVPGGRKMAIVGRTPSSAQAPQGEWVMTPYEHLGSPDPGHLERWPTDAPHEVHSEPKFNLAFGTVHSALHIPEHYVHKDIQRKMVHGLRLDESGVEDLPHSRPMEARGVSYGSFHKLPNGKLAYIKNDTHGAGALPSRAHREVLYHNALHHLGLGDYVTPTTLFQDPDKEPGKAAEPGDWYSAQEAVEHPEHLDLRNSKHRKLLHDMNMTGELQKIALANQLLGNTDRHSHNFLFGGKDRNRLYLIDHGLSLHDFEDSYSGTFPSYMQQAQIHGDQEGVDHSPLRPAAREWLSKIDPDKFSKFLGKHQVPSSIAYTILDKLKHMQKYANEEPEATFDEVWGYPNIANGMTDIRFTQGAGKRLQKTSDPAAHNRHKQRMSTMMETAANNVARAEGPRKTAQEIVSDYIDQVSQGKNPEPYQMLVDKYGADKVNGLLNPFGVPRSDQELRKRFNDKIYEEGGRLRRQARDWRRVYLANLAGAEKEGKSPESIFNHLEGRQLDDEMHFVNGPKRLPGADDHTYKRQIVAFLKGRA